jgi:hypothetical protein
MRRILAAGAALAAAALGGCTHYHQEVATLRMARPAVEPAQLAAFAKGEPNYPSVGGDILRGTSPTAAAAYDATSGERVPPPEAPRVAP